MQDTYQEEIDGDEVTFEITYSGQAMAVPEGGKTNAARPILVASLVRDGAEVWCSVLPHIITDAVPLLEQITPGRLREMYREVRLSGDSPK